MKILLAVDGSEHSQRAASHVIRLVQGCAQHEVLLLNVQEPIDAPEIRSHLPEREIIAMQETRGGDAMEATRAQLDAASIAYVPEVAIGPVAETIVGCAAERGCDAIVMGSHGAGMLKSMLGSVVAEVISLTDRPVTVVR